jgi:hypothetical protein
VDEEYCQTNILQMQDRSHNKELCGSKYISHAKFGKLWNEFLEVYDGPVNTQIFTNLNPQYH